MKKSTPIFVLCFIIFSSNLFSQYIIDKDIKLMMDSSLRFIDIDESDIWIPNYLNKKVDFLLPAIEEMFNNPLKSIDFVNFHSNYAFNINNNFKAFYGKIFSDLDFEKFEFYDFSSSLPVNIINKRLSTNIDSAVTFISARVLSDYLAPVVQALSVIEKDVISIKDEHSQKLINKIDSLFIIHDENSYDLNEFEFKNQEIQSDKSIKEFLNIAKRYSKTNLYSVGLSLYSKLLEINEKNFKIIDMFKDSLKTTIINTKYGRVAIGGKGDDIYSGEYFMIIDIGGNDKYYIKSTDKSKSVDYPINIIIDFAGDDYYFGDNYSLGGALIGISILLDYSGNDVYYAGNFSLGSGFLGVGIFEDFAGNDKYFGKTFTQGAGAFGLGIFIDDSGNDLYNCNSHGQGFGFVNGYGILIDKNGADIYTLLSQGLHETNIDGNLVSFSQGSAKGIDEFAGGGFGLLLDKEGNDIYFGENYCQGIGYNYGLGALIDKSGDDSYQSSQYVQGCGIKKSFGILFDETGNDIYSSKRGSKGYGLDLSFGCLIDKNGEDNYIVEDLSLGSAINKSISLFIDKAGDDSYSIQNYENSLGYSDNQNFYTCTGLFIDGDGQDKYTSNILNNTQTYKSNIGAFSDYNSIIEKSDNKNNIVSPFDNKTSPKLANSMDSLFIQASTRLFTFQNVVIPAREKIASLGMKSLSFLTTKLSTENPNEKLAMVDILSRLMERGNNEFGEYLVNSLKIDKENSQVMLISLIGKYKIKSGLPIILNYLNSKDLAVKLAAIDAIGQIGNGIYIDSLMPYLQSEDVFIRARAAYSIIQLDKSQQYFDSLLPLLKDKSQIVRNSVLKSMIDNYILDFSNMKNIFNVENDDFIKLQFIPKFVLLMPSKTEIKSIKNIILEQSIRVRTSFYKEILTNGINKWQEQLKGLSKAETNPDLKKLIGVKKREKREK